MRKIKLHYPTAVVLEATIRKHLRPKPGDIVVVFDPTSFYIGNITILVSIDGGNKHGMPFIAPASLSDCDLHNWTHAYKVPEGYASVDYQNDK